MGLKLSVLLEMNAVQFTLDGFELLFFSTVSTMAPLSGTTLAYFTLTLP